MCRHNVITVKCYCKQRKSLRKYDNEIITYKFLIRRNFLDILYTEMTNEIKKTAGKVLMFIYTETKQQRKGIAKKAHFLW